MAAGTCNIKPLIKNILADGQCCILKIAPAKVSSEAIINKAMPVFSFVFMVDKG